MTAVQEQSELEEELRRLELRHKMLRTQNEIRCLETESTAPREYKRIINFCELDMAIPMLSGDDFYDIEKWMQQFEDYTNMVEYGEREKCLGIHRRLCGTAKNYIFTLGSLSFDELKSKLLKIFKRTITRKQVYNQLYARKLLPNETCFSYVIAMELIANQVKMIRP